MALGPRTKGGQGGKKGHSNMAHYTGTEEIKRAHKKHLRQDAKRITREHLSEGTPGVMIISCKGD